MIFSDTKTMVNDRQYVCYQCFEVERYPAFHAALISRNGQLMGNLSLHDGNTNKTLSLPQKSGSGKSFLTSKGTDLLLPLRGAQVWVIDASKSYQKCPEMLQGRFCAL